EDGRRVREVAETDDCIRGRRQSAFTADEELRQIRSVLRQQVFEGIGRRLATESAELGADDGKVLCGNLGESRHLGETRSGEEAPSGAVDDSHLDDVVDRASG